MALSLSLRIDSFGDRGKATNLVPFVVNNLLAQFKRKMALGALNYLEDYYELSDKSIVQITGITIGVEPQYIIKIFSPLVSGKQPAKKELILVKIYLVTIGFPSVEGAIIDVNGENLYKAYCWKLVSNALIKTTIPTIQYQHAVNLTSQFDRLLNISFLADSFSHKETLDFIIPNAFSNVDRNAYWGLSYPDEVTGDLKLVGANLAQDGILSPLKVSYNARQNFSVENGIKNYNFQYQRDSLGIFSPINILESIGSSREFYHHKLYSLPADAYTSIGYDQIDGVVWNYYVPIVAVAKSRMLMRKVDHVSDGVDCGTSHINEILAIGDTVIDNFSYEKISSISPVIVGLDTVSRNTSYLYTVPACSWPENWTVTGTDVTIGEDGILHVGSTACGMITIGVTCHGCGKVTKRVKVDVGSWTVIGTCGVNTTELAAHGCGENWTLCVPGTPTCTGHHEDCSGTYGGSCTHCTLGEIRYMCGFVRCPKTSVCNDPPVSHFISGCTGMTHSEAPCSGVIVDEAPALFCRVGVAWGKCQWGC